MVHLDRYKFGLARRDDPYHNFAEWENAPRCSKDWKIRGKGDREKEAVDQIAGNETVLEEDLVKVVELTSVFWLKFDLLGEALRFV